MDPEEELRQEEEEEKEDGQTYSRRTNTSEKDLGRAKNAGNVARKGTKVARTGSRIASQAGKQAVRTTGRVAAQAGTQAARVTAQFAAQAAAQVARVAAILAAQAAAAVASATAAAIAATSEFWVPIGVIIAVVALVIVTVTTIFMFFMGTPTTIAGEPTPEPNICVGLCKASCLDSESDLGVNTVSCTDTTATHCCLPAGTLPPLKFYCEYGGVNGSGVLTDRGSWDYSLGGGQVCNIDPYGCTPTSIAMIMSSYGNTFTPTQVSQQSNAKGCFATGSHPDRAFITSQGFTMTGSLIVGGNLSLTTLQSYLSHGYYILAGGNIAVVHNDGLQTNKIAHAFVITGVDLATGAVAISDPTACEDGFSNGTRTLTNVNASGGDVNGWFWAYAIKSP